MKTTHAFIVFTVAVAGLSGITARAQNIVNDTLVVGTEATAEIAFPSPPNGILSTPDGSYEVNSGTKKSLLIKANKKDAKPQSLTVDEGSRKHRFVLVYAENAPALRRDWSKQKALTAHVKELKDKAEAGLAEADARFDKGQYDAALEMYNRLVYDVEEAGREPIRQKITKCEEFSQKGKEKKFNDALTRGDVQAAAAKFKEADAAYAAALLVFPGSADAQTKRQKNTEAWYKAVTRRGDSAAKAKNSALALTFFDEAEQADSAKFNKSTYKAQYRQLADDAVKQAYEQQKETGDEAFAVHDWVSAKRAYKSALSLKGKAEDKYCLGRLKNVNEAETKEGEDKRKEAEYYAVLSTAKKREAAQDFEGAIAKYNAAIALFPDRRFAKEKKAALARRGSSASTKR